MSGTNSEQDVNRMTESLVNAQTRAVNLCPVKTKTTPCQPNKLWFDETVKKGIILQNLAIEMFKRYRTSPNKANETIGELGTKFLNSSVRENESTPLIGF